MPLRLDLVKEIYTDVDQLEHTTKAFHCVSLLGNLQSLAHISPQGKYQTGLHYHVYDSFVCLLENG